MSCLPLTRDRANPGNIALNDVLGNYSLTLIDSLSTLAILASAPPDDRNTAARALRDFQDGVAALVEQYGDGTPGPGGQGVRARGFDLDSKVQVFETVIRGLGGLLSAHLFAVGDLPIREYSPQAQHQARATAGPDDGDDTVSIQWPNGFRYDGQLLRLALDLAQRLLPAFYTQTGIPYPRVNLRYGIPFYVNSPLHDEPEHLGGASVVEGPPEITETCSAGAGSLVLEFTVLSRLTGDSRFEEAAKRAFWAVWERRSNIGLIGAGVDAEGGHWIGSYAGIGAGADSFFEYALKTHILLSGQDLPNLTKPLDRPRRGQGHAWLDPNRIYTPLTPEEHDSDSFLEAWHHAHAAIKRHLYSDVHHPHYINANLATGSPQAYWIDSLGAYYAGLLSVAGELDEAIETHLLYTALWTRYGALPERWSVRERKIEGGLGWWPGRPELIESTYHIYRSTQDPYYLYVGEMILRDISRRCWTECGWAGLQDVTTGEKNDRMESFFLGETAKYMYLLFDGDHPLNKLDASFVFTTEGHPLLIPRRKKKAVASPTPTTAKEIPRRRPSKRAKPAVSVKLSNHYRNTCPVPPKLPPLTGSTTAARPDLYHAAKLTGLHVIPNFHAGLEAVEVADGSSAPRTFMMAKSNYTTFPWTLPQSMLPGDGMCPTPPEPLMMTIEFPTTTQQAVVGSAFNLVFGSHAVSRISDGLVINNLSGLKISIVLEDLPDSSDRAWRVINVAGVALGRDEKVFIPRDVIGDIADPVFHRIKDQEVIDILIQQEVVETEDPDLFPVTEDEDSDLASPDLEPADNVGSVEEFDDDMCDAHLEDSHEAGHKSVVDRASEYKSLLSSLLRQVTSAFQERHQSLQTPLVSPSTLPSSSNSLSGSASSEATGSASSSRSPPHPPHSADGDKAKPRVHYTSIPAVLPVGVGAVPPPDVPDAPFFASSSEDSPPLSWHTVAAGGYACPRDSSSSDSASGSGPLPYSLPRDHQVLVLRRGGGCTFNQKLASIPGFVPSPRSLQLVIVVSDGDADNPTPGYGSSSSSATSSTSTNRADGHEGEGAGAGLPHGLSFRPLLDEPQRTPRGVPRRHPIPMVLVAGGDAAYDALTRARQIGIRRRYRVESQGINIGNIIIV